MTTPEEIRTTITLLENQIRAEIFRTGLCDAMAVALHRKTKLPLGLWRGYYPDDDGEEGEEAYQDCHAVVVKSFNPPVWIDVDGEHNGEPNCLFTVPVTRVELEPATEEEVLSAFCIDDSTHEESLKKAEEYLKNRNG